VPYSRGKPALEPAGYGRALPLGRHAAGKNFGPSWTSGFFAGLLSPPKAGSTNAPRGGRTSGDARVQPEPVCRRAAHDERLGSASGDGPFRLVPSGRHPCCPPGQALDRSSPGGTVALRRPQRPYPFRSPSKRGKVSCRSRVSAASAPGGGNLPPEGSGEALRGLPFRLGDAAGQLCGFKRTAHTAQILFGQDGGPGCWRLPYGGVLRTPLPPFPGARF